MKKWLLIGLISWSPLFCLEGFAQQMTFFNDYTKQNQIGVMESGAGFLNKTYYTLMFHRKYYKMASLPPFWKITSRTAAVMSLSAQKEEADSIQKDLGKRAKEEVANLIEQNVDVAWGTIGKDILRNMAKLKENINSLNGRTDADEVKWWNELVGQLEFAIKVTRNSWLSNSARQTQYMKISNTVNDTNRKVIVRVQYLTLKAAANKLAKCMGGQNHHRVKEESQAAYNRWNIIAQKGIHEEDLSKTKKQ